MKVTLRKKISVLILLLIISLILFFFYTITKSSTEKKTGDNVIINFDAGLTGNINREINEIFYSFGIKDIWINDKTNKVNPEHPEWFYKEVIIPKDINSSEIILELTNHLKKYNLYDRVYEEPRSGNIKFDIFYRNAFSLSDTSITAAGKDSLRKAAGINLIYSDTARRENKYVTLILDNLQNHKLEDVMKILSSTEKYSVVLPLSNEKSDYQSAIYESNKDYILKFTVGDENNMTADFRTDMPEKAWKSKIRTTSLAYFRAGGVILTGMPAEAGYAFINDISEEFRRNNMNVYPDTMFIFFTSDRENELKIKELIDNIISAGKSKDHIFYIADLSADEFAIYDKEIYPLKKKGYSFNNFKNSIRKAGKLLEPENTMP